MAGPVTTASPHSQHQRVAPHQRALCFVYTTHANNGKNKRTTLNIYLSTPSKVKRYSKVFSYNCITLENYSHFSSPSLPFSKLSLFLSLCFSLSSSPHFPCLLFLPILPLSFYYSFPISPLFYYLFPHFLLNLLHIRHSTFILLPRFFFPHFPFLLLSIFPFPPPYIIFFPISPSF